MQSQLTKSSTLHFLRRDRKDRQYLDHNLNNHVRHCRSWCDANIYLEAAEEMFKAIKDLDKFVSDSACTFDRLGPLGVKMGRTREGCRMLTESRTPMPVKITVAGGNA